MISFRAVFITLLGSQRKSLKKLETKHRIEQTTFESRLFEKILFLHMTDKRQKVEFTDVFLRILFSAVF